MTAASLAPSGTKHIPQPAEQTDFALPFAGVAAEAEIHERPARQRGQRPETRDREAETGLLVVDLRVDRLVRGASGMVTIVPSNR